MLRRVADSNLNVNDRSLTQLLELVMNQKCIRDTKQFACFETWKSLRHETRSRRIRSTRHQICWRRKVFIAWNEEVYFVERPSGPGHNNPSLVVDAMKAAFHKEQTFSDKMEDIMYPKFGRNLNAPSGKSSSGSNGGGTAPTVSRHFVNLFSFNDPNIPSGVLVDTEITHPSFKQFFLNAHRTLQGTAKTPMYTILADDFNAPMDKLETLTYTLCHHHQIVSLATSLPAPLYIANEYAKRGQALWRLKTAGCVIPADNNGNEIRRPPRQRVEKRKKYYSFPKNDIFFHLVFVKL